jgi:hypothetical protein
MRLDFTATIAKRQSKFKKQFNFHPWFAWYPVKVGIGQYCWLEVLHCKNTGSSSKPMWVYRRRHANRS